MRWLKRVIAAAVLSMSTVLAGVGATYGQDTVDRVGFQKNSTITQIRISDAARRPGT
jgi:sulfonate transport system substrate-binding protein